MGICKLIMSKRVDEFLPHSKYECGQYGLLIGSLVEIMYYYFP